MEISGTTINIVSMTLATLGFITAELASKRVKKLEHQLVDMKLAATKISILEQQLAEIKDIVQTTGTE